MKGPPKPQKEILSRAGKVPVVVVQDAVQVAEAERKVKAAAQAKERRDHLLARMAGNIAAGIDLSKLEPWAPDEVLAEFADLAVRLARAILKQIEEGS